jgi:hypothetical protein
VNNNEKPDLTNYTTEILESFSESNEGLCKSMKYNYAFLNIHKQLHQYIKEHRFSDKVSAGIQLEQITSILQN